MRFSVKLLIDKIITASHYKHLFRYIIYPMRWSTILNTIIYFFRAYYLLNLGTKV